MPSGNSVEKNKKLSHIKITSSNVPLTDFLLKLSVKNMVVLYFITGKLIKILNNLVFS